MKIPHNISRADAIIRAVTASNDIRRALNEHLGAPGSKKRKGMPKSLRKRVQEAVLPDYIPSGRKREIPFTQSDFVFRNGLRKIDARNSLYSLENERRALALLDDTMKEILGGKPCSMREEHGKLKQTFDHYGVPLREVLLTRYEDLLYSDSQQESNEKNIYGKLLLYENKKFDVGKFSPDETNFEEVVEIMAPLDGDEKRIFIGTVLFDPSLDEEEVPSFIQALTVAATHGDEIFNEETQNAIAAVGGSMLDQAFELATNRFASRQDYAMLGIKHFKVGVTTKKVDTKRGYETDDSEDAAEDYWHDYEYYEDTRHEILLCAIEEKMVVPTQLEFEKLYEAATYNGTRFKFLRLMVDAAGRTLKKRDVVEFMVMQAENTLDEDPSYDLWRKMNAIEQLSKLQSVGSMKNYAMYLDHKDIYLALAALRSLLRTHVFKGQGVEFVARKIIEDSKAGNYRLLGLATLGAAAYDDQTRNGCQKVMSRVFASDINMAQTYGQMDGLVLPLNPRGYVSSEMYSKDANDFISAIGLDELSKWIINPVTLNQRKNAREVFQMFPSHEIDIFMTTAQGKLLLKKLGIQPE